MQLFHKLGVRRVLKAVFGSTVTILLFAACITHTDPAPAAQCVTTCPGGKLCCTSDTPICCDGRDKCATGKCSSNTTVQCATFTTCGTCTPQVGCAFCPTTKKCLDQFGSQGPDWDSCPSIVVDPSGC